MSTSRINKSAILTQKLDNLRTQGKKLHLVIAPPRSVSTAFTRALCHASDADGVHELLDNLKSGNGSTDNILPHKKNVIFKEMAQTENGNPTEYLKLLNIIANKVETPIIIITANPQTVFLSMMQASAKIIIKYLREDYGKDYDYPKTILKRFMTNYERTKTRSITYTNHNMSQIEEIIDANPEKILILNSHNIKTHPKEAVDIAQKTWFPEISPQEDLHLSPVVTKFTKQSYLSEKWASFRKKEYTRHSEYLLSYDDKWVSKDDRAKKYFRPHPQTSEDIPPRIEKIKDSIVTDLMSKFENVQASDIIRFGLMTKIEHLIQDGLSKIEPSHL